MLKAKLAMHLLFGLLLTAACLGAADAKPKGASFTVKATFNATSYLLEAVEFLAEEDGQLVWPFLDRVTDASSVVSARANTSEDVCWGEITGAAASLVTPGVAQLLPLVLGSRQYAAKLQMVRQLAQQFHPQESACCFVSVDGRVATTPPLLADLLGEQPQQPAFYSSYSKAEQLFPFDHVYGTGNRGGSSSGDSSSASGPPPPRVAVLYGSPGLPCFGTFHRQLVRAAEEAAAAVAVAAAEGRAGVRGLVYAFRPLLQPQCEPYSGCGRLGTGGPLLLPGWGVEAALKNTEYSAADEKTQQQHLAAAAAAAAAAGDKQEGEDAPSDAADAVFGSGPQAAVKGFRFDLLAARRPGLRQELLTLRDTLLAADDDEAAIKVWELRDVGLQAAQRILGSSDPLALLGEVAGNFPGLVASLSRQPVSASLRSAASANQQLLPPGSNWLLLNGMALDANNLDYFGFLSLLRSELRLRDALVTPPAAPPSTSTTAGNGSGSEGEGSAAGAGAGLGVGVRGGGLGLPAGLAARIMALRAEEGEGAGSGGGGGGRGGGGGEAGAEEPRLNLGSPSTVSSHVSWLNDLERDARYSRYGRSLMELLHTFPGRFRPLARNAFTAVLVAQPLCAPSLELAGAVEQMWNAGYPIRFGVVFHLPSVVARVERQRRQPGQPAPPLPAWQDMDASERFGRAFLTLRSAFGHTAAWRLWSEVAEAVGSGAAYDAGAQVEAAFEAAWTAAARSPPPGARAKVAARKSAGEALGMLREGKGYAAEVGMQLSDTASWLLAKGLVQPPPATTATAATATTAMATTQEPDSDDGGEGSCAGEGAVPLVWLNGAVARAGGGEAAAQDLLMRTMSEMQRLQEWLYYGRLADDSAGGDVLAAVMELSGGGVERRNPRIVGPAAASAQVVPLAPLLSPAARNATSLLALWRDPPPPPPASTSSKSGSGSRSPSASPGRLAAVTHHVVADLGGAEGRALLAEALRYLTDLAPQPPSAASTLFSPTKTARLVLLLNPTAAAADTNPAAAAAPSAAASDPAAAAAAAAAAPPRLLEALVVAAGRQAAEGDVATLRPKLLVFLSRLFRDSDLTARLAQLPTAAAAAAAGGGGQVAEAAEAPGAEDLAVAAKYAEEAGLDSAALLASLASKEQLQQLQSYIAVHSEICRTVFKLQPGAAAVVSNGRVTPVLSRPGGESLELLAEDLALLQRMAAGEGPAGAVAGALRAAHAEQPLQGVPPGLASPAAQHALSDLAAAATSQLALAAAAGGGSGGGGSSSGGRPGAGVSRQLQAALDSMRGLVLEDPGASPSPPFQLAGVLDPLSRAAQRLAPLLALLRGAMRPGLRLVLHPAKEVTELPLKSYYRLALPQFPPSSAPASSSAPPPGPPAPPSASFSALPSRRVLTINLDVPEAWLVGPAEAEADLDNLRLEDVGQEVVHAEFELEALMLTGSCVDVTASGRMTPPRGLQLHLGTPARPHTVDTLVMANLAYFQLKTAPGRWLLSLAPGRSRELYSLVGGGGSGQGGQQEGDAAASATAVTAVAAAVEGAKVAEVDSDISTEVLISSFSGQHMVLRVRKRPGREGEDVLKEAAAGGAGGAAEEEESGEGMPAEGEYDEDEYGDPDEEDEQEAPRGLLGRVSSLLMGGKRGRPPRPPAPKPAPRPGGDTINVFTVASGHMYERLQKIMILSVVRHTKSKVKFWIIKNYMSPQHKQVIPALAEQFGFEYEFVTYKWPQWLHKQTDKQRVIWAYKILFLDVLFPLGVERIIFVDSDQVVRADLGELYGMDLQGAPYAYTPFCDNSAEMDEYRFWKGGFWRDHLQGKPYHISALYLVDLKRFRQIAAGDQLRVVYDQLSKDPNSLANLDQDLPNYAQHSIKIFSLPQEWLWCESWCGNATKDRAKTIDLCNNPKTKEPKLVAARRIIGPLWSELDSQQQRVTREVQSRLEAAEGGLLPPPPEVLSQGGSSEEVEAAAGAEQQQQQQQQRGAEGADRSEL